MSDARFVFGSMAPTNLSVLANTTLGLISSEMRNTIHFLSQNNGLSLGAMGVDGRLGNVGIEGVSGNSDEEEQRQKLISRATVYFGENPSEIQTLIDHFPILKPFNSSDKALPPELAASIYVDYIIWSRGFTGEFIEGVDASIPKTKIDNYIKLLKLLPRVALAIRVKTKGSFTTVGEAIDFWHFWSPNSFTHTLVANRYAAPVREILAQD